MATYGISATPGFVQFTGYTPTLGASAANVDATTGRVQFNGISQGDFYINQPIGLGGQVAAVQQLLLTILGATAGATATKTKRQVQGVLGSSAPAIETVTLINRATTAADIAAFQAMFTRLNGPITYAADVSGNGGGGKQQVAGGAY
jgi:hypothetical protein